MGRRISKNQRKSGRKTVKNIVEKPKRNITDVNTDCLIEIFQYLKHTDWLNLKLAHGAFSDAVDYMVQKNEIEFEITSEKGSTEYFEQLEFFKRYVEQFGKVINCLNIEIDGDSCYDRRIEASIEKYCLNGKIQHCSFNRLQLRSSFVLKNLPFFSSLVSLQLIYSIGTVDEAMLLNLIATNCSIREFLLISYKCEFKKNFDLFRTIASSKLEIFHFSSLLSHSDLTREVADLPMNYTLKELCLGGHRFDPLILTHFPNIESIKRFNADRKYSLKPILTLTALKSFELFCENLTRREIFSFLSKLADQNSLESLALVPDVKLNNTNCEAVRNKLANILCKMTNLKRLKLDFKFGQQLLIIGNCLKNLKEISFDLEPIESDLISLLEFINVSRNLEILIIPDSEYFRTPFFIESVVNIRREQQAIEVLHIGSYFPIEGVNLSDEQKRYIRFI